MSQSLQSILRKCGSPSHSHTFTHEVLGNGGSRWDVSRASLGEFISSYCDLVFQQEAQMTLAERPKETMPIIIQMTLTFDSGTRGTHDDRFIHSLVYSAQKTLLENLQVNANSDELICVVLASELVEVSKGKSLLCIRLQFPCCKVDINCQKNIIYPRLIQKFRHVNIASQLFVQPIVSDWEKIIDHDMIQQAVPMFGSSKDNEEPIMDLNAIYELITDESFQTFDVEKHQLELSEIFDPLQYGCVAQGLIYPTMFSSADVSENHWLPVFLSVDYAMKITLPKKVPGKTPVSQHSIFGSNVNGIYDLKNFGVGDSIIDNMTPMDLCLVFADMWSITRRLNMNEWLTAGEAFYDASNGDDEGLEAWIAFTKKAVEDAEKAMMDNVSLRYDIPKDFLEYDGCIEDMCSSEYFTFKPGRYTCKAMGWNAQDDSPSKYEQWHKAWCSKSIEKAILYQTDTAVGRAIARVYWLEYIFTHEGNGKRKTCYEFSGHRYKIVPNAHKLSRRISDDFVRRIDSIRTEISAQVEKSQNDQERASGDKIISLIPALKRALETSSRKNSFINEASLYLTHDDLDTYLDDNPEILGLPNGVVVATSTGIQIRPGRPEDYVTRSTLVPYRKDFTWDHPLVKETMEWMHQIFVDDELFHHFMKFCASLLRGGNPDKHISVFSGLGDNSKSMLIKLFECIFGPYCIKIPIAMAGEGGRSNPNGPSPAIARAKSTRLCILEEPDDDEELKEGILKHLSGSDSFFARLLKKNGGDIKPLFKLILACNNPPRVNRGKAIENRWRIFPFLSTWVDDPEEAKRQYGHDRFFKLDPMFDRKIARFAPAMLWIMVQYYPIYIAEGVRKTPEIVQKHTKKYWEETDTYFQYIADNVEVAVTKEGYKDESQKLNVNQLYSSFKIWYKNAYPRSKNMPNMPKFKKELSTRCGNSSDGYWSGLKLKIHGYDQNAGYGGFGGIGAIPTH